MAGGFPMLAGDFLMVECLTQPPAENENSCCTDGGNCPLPANSVFCCGSHCTPGEVDMLHFPFHSPPPGLFRSPPAPPSRWIPPQCLSCDVFLFFPQCVTKPSPLPLSDLLLNWLLLCNSPQLFICHPFRPEYLHDSP